MMIRMMRSLARYREAVTDRDPEITRDLALTFLDLLEGGGTWEVDDRGGWIQLDQIPDGEINRLHELLDAFGG